MFRRLTTSHLILFNFVLFVSFSVANSNFNFIEKSNNFLNNVIQNKLPFCDIIFAHDNPTIYHEVILQTSSELFHLPQIGGFYGIEITLNSSLTSFKNIHKLHVMTYCTVVVLLIQNLYPGLDQHLFNVLTPHYGPISRKDLDFYFFKSLNGESERTNELMLSSRFGNKIRYKIGISMDVKTKTLIYNTVHPYFNRGNPLLINLVDLSKSEKPWEQPMNNLFPDMSDNHYGRGIKTSVPNCTWRYEIQRGADGLIHPKRGYYAYWLDEATKKWNFTYDLFVSSLSGGTGAHLKNGTWLGAVGDVYYEEAEIATVVGHIYSRHKYLDWSAPLSYEWMVFMCHKPKSFYSAKAIFWPFRSDTWLLFFFCIILTIFALKILLQFSYGQNSYLNQEWSVIKITSYIYTTILEQDANTPSKTTPIRIFCLFWLLFALIGSQAYRAKLVSVIAFPISSWIPTTFEELAPSSFKMGLNVVGKGGAAYDLFRSSTNPAFQTIVAKMSIHPLAIDCLTLATNEEFCCCLWQGISDFEGAKNISDRFGRSVLQTSTSTAFFINDGLVFQKGAIFRHHFDRTIWNAIEMGLVNQWTAMDLSSVRESRGKWEKSVNKTGTIIADDDGPKKLQVAHFISGFAIILIGFSAGLMSFIYELSTFKLYTKNDTNRNDVIPFQKKNKINSGL